MAELDDLDLDTDLLAAAVVVEWGEGMAERLAAEHLLIRLERPRKGPSDDNCDDSGDSRGDGRGDSSGDDRRVAQLCGPARLIPEPACLAVP
jgi:tRNA threonylcarbamoyladenosine biosynthesis protein TsaE